MSNILTIGLLIIFGILTAALIILMKRLEKIQSQTRKLEEQASIIQKNEPQTPQRETHSPTTYTPEPVKSFFTPPNIPENARPEKVAELYSKLPGVIATLFSDRFGQPVAFETQLETPMDKALLSASIVEALRTTPKLSLGIGKETRKVVFGEKSFWVLTSLGGFPSGIWFEESVPVEEAIELVKKLEKSLAKSLRNYYKMLW